MWLSRAAVLARLVSARSASISTWRGLSTSSRGHASTQSGRASVAAASAIGIVFGAAVAASSVAPRADCRASPTNEPDTAGPSAHYPVTRENARRVGAILSAAREVLDDCGGIAMLFTLDCQRASGSASCVPNGRPVEVFSLPHVVGGEWLDRLFIPTNVHTRKVAELGENANCALSAFDLKGNYFVMRGEVVSLNDKRSRSEYERINKAAWEENGWQLWPFFADGPDSSRFCLLEFVPREVKVVSTAREIAHEPNGWEPAFVVRAGRGEATGEGSALAGLLRLVGLGGNGGVWRLKREKSEAELLKLRGGLDVYGEAI